MERAARQRETRFGRADAILLAVLAIQWIFCMGAILNREWNRFSTSGPPVARSLVRQHERFRYRRMGIYRKGVRIGFTETTIRPEADGAFSIATRTEALLNIFFRTPMTLTCASTLTVGPEGEPRHLYAKLGVPKRPDLNVEIEGMRQGARMHIMVKQVSEGVENILYRESIPVEGSAEVDTGLVPLGDLPGLSVGREWAVRYVNPLTRRTQHGRARVTGIEPVEWRGETIRCFRVEVDFDGSAYLQPIAHIAPDGRLLRLGGILGYSFEREPRPTESPLD